MLLEVKRAGATRKGKKLFLFKLSCSVVFQQMKEDQIHPRRYLFQKRELCRGWQRKLSKKNIGTVNKNLALSNLKVFPFTCAGILSWYSSLCPIILCAFALYLQKIPFPFDEEVNGWMKLNWMWNLYRVCLPHSESEDSKIWPTKKKSSKQTFNTTLSRL